MSVTATNVAARLGTAIGAAQVHGNAELCGQYAVDAVVPAAVAAPTCAAEVAEIVQFAKSEKLVLIPCGKRTKLNIGMPPARYDVAVDMTGLNQIAYYDPADLTLSVEAGLGLVQLADILRRQNQFVPMAVPFFDECTVGGTVASGIGSTLRPGYGSARDFLLGAEFVNGTGALTRSGGRVVKNVTGYDLHKLLIGSLGTLGIITRLNFRTFPVLQSSGHFAVTFSTVEAILRFRAVVAKSPLTLSLFEIFGPEAAQRLAESTRGDEAPAPSWFAPGLWHIFVAFEGTEAILRRYSFDLIEFAQQTGASNCNLLDEAVGKVLSQGLREFLKELSSASAATVFKISVLPALPADVLHLRAIAERHSIPCSLFGSNSGPLYFSVVPPILDAATIAALAQVSSGVFEFAAAHNGQASILFSPTELKRGVNVWGSAKQDAELMRRVKNAFDPHNIFAPGRFVADI
jgi:glycolate oxidase FAD binding subunit